MMRPDERLVKLTRTLSDDQLMRELGLAQRKALLSTRCCRDLALLRVRCLRCEADRRALLKRPVDTQDARQTVQA
ncbi:MAG: hypothetical protein NVS2B16_20950 [Chloroflexota bacterium]